MPNRGLVNWIHIIPLPQKIIHGVYITGPWYYLPLRREFFFFLNWRRDLTRRCVCVNSACVSGVRALRESHSGAPGSLLLLLLFLHFYFFDSIWFSPRPRRLTKETHTPPASPCSSSPRAAVVVVHIEGGGGKESLGAHSCCRLLREPVPFKNSQKRSYFSSG